jgi:hypothetical protein
VTRARRPQAKIDAHKNIGGGAAGVASRVTLDAKRMKVCKICGQQAPDLKSLSLHYESKHPKSPFNEADFKDG